MLKRWCGRRGDELSGTQGRSIQLLGDDQGSGFKGSHHYHVAVRGSDCPNVRNLLMVPSRRRVQVLKATKLTEVSEVRDEEEEPQCNGRGEGGQGNNLEGSNDGKSAQEV